MNWLTNIFGTSDYLERDPKKKLDVGLAHAFVGGVLIAYGIAMFWVMAIYIGKEIIFDMWRVWRGGSSKWLNNIWKDRLLAADSATDAAFWYLGAAMFATSDYRYGVAAVIAGSAYFIAAKVVK